MMKIEQLQTSQLLGNMHEATTIAMCKLLPLEILHMFCAGTHFQWRNQDGWLTAVPQNNVIVLDNEANQKVIVCEERNGEWSAKAFKYIGQRRPY